MEEVRKKKKEAEAECERLAVERKELLEKEAVKTRPYVEMAERMMDAVYEDLISTVTNHILLINEETGLEEFIIGGSWSSLMIANAINSISNEEENRCRAPVLEANDVDVYHGAFSTEAPEMIVFLDQIKYTQVDEFQWEINTVKCDGLSAENFLANNDLNVTASCFHVDMSTEKLFTVHASPCFWEFVFQEAGVRMIKTVKPFADDKYEASTCIRIAYKAYRMNLGYSFGDIDPTRGTLAYSHKSKFDDIKKWVGNPFQEYQ